MMRRAALDGGLIFAGMLAMLIWIQAGSGAFTGDLAGHSDEAAHAVSGLLVADYLTYGFPDHPMRFAERYYVRYPKVAIGHWPPLFHVLEGVWMRTFGRTKAVMLLWLAVTGAALATGVADD